MCKETDQGLPCGVNWLQSSPDEHTRCFGSQMQKEHQDFAMPEIR
jgi:hypothetical protein